MSLNTGRVEALILDMDGTMIDSMPWHARSWVTFAQRHGVQLDVSEILARTTGRTGTESMRELFERELSDAECQAMVHEKEEIYRELFHDNFTEVAGFTARCRWPSSAATKAFRASPRPRSSWKPRAASAWRPSAASSSKTRPSASKPPAAAACAPWPCAAPIRPPSWPAPT